MDIDIYLLRKVVLILSIFSGMYHGVANSVSVLDAGYVSPNMNILKNLNNGLNGSHPVTNFMETYKTTVNILLSVVTITVIIIFILNIVNFGRAEDNPRVRYESKMGVFWSGLCLFFLGSINVFYLVFLGIL